jgi:hypothetical protein
VSHGHLSQRLFIQAAITAGYPLLWHGRTNTTWMLIGFALAAACAGLALFVHKGHANARAAVIGFEVLALAVGGLALTAGHYVPGSIVGAWTLVAVFTSSEPVARNDSPAHAATGPEAPGAATYATFAPGATQPLVAPEPVPAMVAAQTSVPAAPVEAPQQAAAPMAAPLPASRNILPGK